MRPTSTSYRLKHLGYLLLALLLTACSLEKESGLNRSLQNLTAHYNILFNANEILKQKQLDYQQSYIDNYTEFLSVYQDSIPSVKQDKDLDAAIAKANNIIAIKEQSHYIADAYLVLGKANHLYGRYYNAIEFDRYVITSFPKRADLKQEARVWQVRSLLYLNQMTEAKAVLDSALANINPKKSITADVYATALQYHIEAQEYTEAEAMAKLAIKRVNDKTQRLRWTFILAQLQELNKEPGDADASYTRVVHSNASFELAFNADLNRIRLEDAANGVKISRMDRLRSLLKDDKNKEFIDQIYYQMALLYLANNDIDNAIKNLKLSVRNSSRNVNQKGVSYLRLADITFKNKGDYVMAKKYYDSTLLNLSTSYPDYALIQRKSANLQILADRLQIIAREDTLQLLAKLDEKDRTARIDEMVANHTKQVQAAQAAAQQSAAGSTDPFAMASNGASNPNSTNSPAGSNTGNSFYFYNPASLSQGFTDFKKRWGNRKLEDNWRRSKRSGSDMTSNAANLAQGVDPNAVPNQIQRSTEDIEAGGFRQGLVQNIPLTKQQMDQSNLKVYNAYLDIANFYRDILDDKKEAVESYETLLTRFPEDPNKPMIYYNLYRLYYDLGDPKAELYKKLLLDNYAQSVYAKVIIDPDYGRKLNDKDAEFNAFYNQVYDLLTERKYPDALSKADLLLKQYPDNTLVPQLAYLRAIANGHQEKLEPFRQELLAITSKYPNDRLVVPLINQHLLYIDENRAKMEQREFALMDNDPNEAPFIPALSAQPSRVLANNPPVQQKLAVENKPVVAPPKTTPPANPPAKTETVPPVTNNTAQNVPPPVTEVPPVTTPPVTTPPVTNPVVDNQPKAPVTKPVEPPSIFNMRDSTNYYFVVNVGTGTTNLASSRFGIGQYNRVHYADASVKHQLKTVGTDNQLIYVGVFNSIGAAKAYARGIIPLMAQIMKVPADKYSFFIITQENLNKLADKKTLDSYIDYYQKNY